MSNTRVLEVRGQSFNCSVLSIVHLKHGACFIAQVEVAPGYWKQVDGEDGLFATPEAAVERATQFVAELLS
ncbi:hypothetical protein [Caballeronia sp. PC1]|uniref:hypothetical protein n=1 Tax=Caballeronia sp. PC1 TaxID=2906765 RepID=UPI001F44EB2A|nr:hypothetical protein [Caballeronia sp. PC1]MCE4544632.1 hypothetical protein [Caballeronia sp. PC1]